MVMLSSRGVSEISPVNEADLKPFDLAEPTHADDSQSVMATNDGPTYGASPLLDVIRQWAEMQRQSFELLAMAFPDRIGDVIRLHRLQRTDYFCSDCFRRRCGQMI